MQDMAKTPSRPRSCPNTEFWLLPLTEDIFRTRVSQPKRAKWKMVVRSDGVILVDKGIQLKRCARHSSAREHIYSLSVSRMGIGWFNNLAALGLCNRLLNRSPRKQNTHLHYESRQLTSNCATTNPSCKAKGIRASGTPQVSVPRFIQDELVIFVSWNFQNFYSDNSNAMGCILRIHYKIHSPPKVKHPWCKLAQVLWYICVTLNIGRVASACLCQFVDDIRADVPSQTKKLT